MMEMAMKILTNKNGYVFWTVHSMMTKITMMRMMMMAMKILTNKKRGWICLMVWWTVPASWLHCYNICFDRGDDDVENDRDDVHIVESACVGRSAFWSIT